MERYMKILLEQIRCQKAHPLVEQEIRGHIEEQIEENLSFGMSADAAEAMAVRDMGDPVETGVSLDRIHRPQIAWNMVIPMAAISVISLLVQFLLLKKEPGFSYDYFSGHILHTVFGFFMMLAVYRIDYSILGKYGKWIGLGLIGLLFFLSYVFGGSVNGASRFLYIGNQSMTLNSWTYFFLPLYAAILYQYRGSNFHGLIKSILWMLPVIIFTLSLPGSSLSFTMLIMMSLLLSIAVCKDWFDVNKVCFLSAFWSALLLYPITFLLLGIKFGWLNDYQKIRLFTFFGHGSAEYNYISLTLKKYMQSSHLIGLGADHISEVLPAYRSDYILASVASYYGVLASVLIITLLLFLIDKIFHIAAQQKNELGMMIGYACGIIFAAATILNILSSSGLISCSFTCLPFLSSGGSNNVVFYMLIGLVLSIYRYKNILPDKIVKKSVSVD